MRHCTILMILPFFLVYYAGCSRKVPNEETINEDTSEDLHATAKKGQSKDATSAEREVIGWVVTEHGEDPGGKDLSPLRGEAIRKFTPIIHEARGLYGEDNETMKTQFAEFKEANPELFTFDVEGASVEHIDAWRIDGEDAHTQVFIWAWLGDIGVIGYADGHVESTTDRALFDRVVSAGRGVLLPQKIIYRDQGTERSEPVPVGPDG